MPAAGEAAKACFGRSGQLTVVAALQAGTAAIKWQVMDDALTIHRLQSALTVTFPSPHHASGRFREARPVGAELKPHGDAGGAIGDGNWGQPESLSE